jgi:hypothetical protein
MCQTPQHAKTISLKQAHGARAPGRIILLKPHSLGVKLVLFGFHSVLERGQSPMQNKLGPEVSAGESGAGDDNRDEKIVDTHASSLVFRAVFQ